ncbi:nitroreductase family protein [Roseateles sp.]|uniref:nitroreductase family protein n=1 Tax=Roseateles sp. TaxID=1971397 RepID=UPI0039EBE0CB
MSERESHHPIDPQFLQRWSPRAFTDERLDEATLLTFLEAARWAPSGFNAQPWRFVYALRGTPGFANILATLSPTNQSWAQRAAALVTVISQQRWTPPGQDTPKLNGMHAFDTGAASAYMKLQASLSGWHAHTVGGFDREALGRNLAVPEDFVVQVVVALGRRGDRSLLPEALQAREQPSTRLPLASLAAADRFGFS